MHLTDKYMHAYIHIYVFVSANFSRCDIVVISTLSDPVIFKVVCCVCCCFYAHPAYASQLPRILIQVPISERFLRNLQCTYSELDARLVFPTGDKMIVGYTSISVCVLN